MEAAVVESISKALGLPRPFLHEPNRAFTQLETWQQLTALLATQPLRIQPLGYYRTPDSVDMYCVLGDADSPRRYCWKIYRRYRHFQKYIAHSSELLASRAVRVPRLSQAYLKIFHAQHCKDRLVELHAWLEGVAENTRDYCHNLQLQHETQAAAKLQELQQQRLAQLEQHAQAKAQRKHRRASISGNTGASRSRTSSRASATSTVSTALKASVPDDPALSLLRFDGGEALPILMLSGFLFAGANCPFPHVFRGIPSFALALEELNVQLSAATVPAVYASKLRSSLATRAGLGLRLTPSHEQDGQFLGATVSGFLRDQQELDPALTDVSIGARLTRINGVNVGDAPFDSVLAQLRTVGLPLRLRFVYNPNAHRLRRAESATTPRSSVDVTEARERPRLPSNGSGGSSSGNSVEVAKAGDGGGSQRSYSVDSRRTTPGLFNSVFGDLFGTGSGGVEAANGGKQRGETADVALGATHHALLNGEAVFSWDEVGGDFRDLISRGFYSFLSPSLLSELREKRRMLKKARSFLPEESEDESDENQEKQEEATADVDRKAQGVWSTATGPLGLCFGACKIRDVEAAMLEVPPTFFSSRAEHRGSEKRLRKGFVLVSINNESTFGVSFAVVMKRLRTASRPTSVCFRWFSDFSPFLETELTEQQGSSSSSSRSLDLRKKPSSGSAARAFESGLDCVSEAQTDLSNSLQLALMENASVRDELGVLQDAHRELRLAQDRAAQREKTLQIKVEQSDLAISKLNKELETRRQELEKTKLHAQEAEALLAANKHEYQNMLESAQASAKTRLAEHEEQLVKESNRSIENANQLAERRSQKLLEAAANETQRRHEEYLQKLAEEHSEEVESLMQQVAVWRHQVEVLTEAEKRNYAALVSNGVNPYQDFQRSRFGYSGSDAPFADLKGAAKDQQRPVKRQDAVAATAATAANWRDGVGSPEDAGGQKHHAFTGTSEQSSQSNSGTFWDRMASLLAADSS
ncbi:hypothetical protein BBJ28_00005805 [Nothophytophthora sp. Chile5]|nr:hypothetical protein BBJ28_00005805 [Nothophytophthora sp. Chile5]